MKTRLTGSSSAAGTSVEEEELPGSLSGRGTDGFSPSSLHAIHSGDSTSSASSADASHPD